jgi:aspartate-semialdehyde dehydrogenase
MVGRVMLQVLQERGFGGCEVLAAASAKSVGKEIDFAGRKLTVMSVDDTIAARPDYAIFSAGVALV